MTLAALFLILALLISRLPLLFRDAPIRRQEALAAWGIQALLILCFVRTAWQSVALLILLLGLHLLWAGLEQGCVWTKRLHVEGADKDRSLHRIRLFMLLALATLGCFAGSAQVGLQMRDARLFLQAAGTWFPPFGMMADWHAREVLIMGSGFLACLTEANGALRWIIERMSLRPKDENDALEYRRGRMIGVLERVIIFALVLQGEYGALGLVLSAKSLARFKSLDDREFAEYFLLGTLLSSLMASVLGVIVRRSLM